MDHPALIYGIALLLPLSALLTVLQRDPYNALISRGILGAVSALVYAGLGAADVAVTEALMGSLLTIVLYSIAVRSSMVVRLGLLAPETADAAPRVVDTGGGEGMAAAIREACGRRHIRLEVTFWLTGQAARNAMGRGDLDIIIDDLLMIEDELPDANDGLSGKTPVVLFRPVGLTMFLHEALRPFEVRIVPWPADTLPKKP